MYHFSIYNIRIIITYFSYEIQMLQIFSYKHITYIFRVSQFHRYFFRLYYLSIHSRSNPR